jgi:biotin operon repressor
MEIIRKIERLELLVKLIKEQCTGNSFELADKLKISRANLFLMLEQLKDEGVEICYSKKINSYVYKKGKVDIKFSYKILSGNDLNIDGGVNKELLYSSRLLVTCYSKLASISFF